jgi:hypothetical protein
MRKFLHFWWCCAKLAAKGNVAFANSWQWLFGLPAFLSVVAYVAAHRKGGTVTTGSPIIDALLTGIISFALTWTVSFLVRLANAPSQLYHQEKERADHFERIRQIANGSHEPSFAIGYEFVPIDGDEIDAFYQAHDRIFFKFSSRFICRIWVENSDILPIHECRLVIEEISPTPSNVANGDTLLIDGHRRTPDKDTSFGLSVSERKYFRFLEYHHFLREQLCVRLLTDEDRYDTGFALNLSILEYGQKYFVTLAIHGENANSRRLRLMIDVISEKEVVVSEEAAPGKTVTAPVG